MYLRLNVQPTNSFIIELQIDRVLTEGQCRMSSALQHTQQKYMIRCLPVTHSNRQVWLSARTAQSALQKLTSLFATVVGSAFNAFELDDCV